MVINKIVLNNFRVYYGVNELSFKITDSRNVSIVAGNNGFGKTSLLTALVWGLYGKLITDVDEQYRQAIYESGGYKRYCEKIMNWKAADEFAEMAHPLQQQLEKVNAIEKRQIEKQVDQLTSFSVAIHLSKIFIPSIPCDEVIIKRNYNTHSNEEQIDILIDGRPNELTRTKGENIFINDFILPKEIAKFFFFDAEKIVSLAEIKTADEKKALSKAYAEVLGLKKYIDLKETLQNLQFRIRSKSSKKEDKARQLKLQDALTKSNKLIAHFKEMCEEKRDELAVKKVAADKLQEQLIREGSSLSIKEFKAFKAVRDNLAVEGQKIKERLNELLEMAPFAIAANKLQQVKDQLEAEQLHANKAGNARLLSKKAKDIAADIKEHKRELGLTADKQTLLMDLINKRLELAGSKKHKTLLRFSDEESHRFDTMYSHLTDSYSKKFRSLISDLKLQQSSFLTLSRKLSDAESKEKDPVIKRIRLDKEKLEESITAIENELIHLEAQILKEQHEIGSNQKILNEITKNILVEIQDQAKDELTERLIKELATFIRRLQLKKKASLETNMQKELNRLMHKKDFVGKVQVLVEGDLIEVELYDKKNQLINKDGLSKGEQQLYATALLRALIAESNIQFPVIIDSPLQKFDKEHSKNIITDFYPSVAAQVILLPLLDKELTEEEYKWLLPCVSETYLISNKEEYNSEFNSIKREKLFQTYRQTGEHV